MDKNKQFYLTFFVFTSNIYNDVFKFAICESLANLRNLQIEYSQTTKTKGPMWLEICELRKLEFWEQSNLKADPKSTAICNCALYALSTAWKWQVLFLLILFKIPPLPAWHSFQIINAPMPTKKYFLKSNSKYNCSNKHKI